MRIPAKGKPHSAQSALHPQEAGEEVTETSNTDSDPIA